MGGENGEVKRGDDDDVEGGKGEAGGKVGDD